MPLFVNIVFTLILVVLFFCSILFADDWSNKRHSRIRFHPAKFVFNLIFALWLALMAFSVLSMVSLLGPQHKDSYGVRDLKSMGTQVNTQGHYSNFFFIGYGNIGDESVYYYYVKDGIGYRLLHIPTSNSHIIERAGNPKVECFSTTLTYFPYMGWETSDDIRKAASCNFYIPKGSIKENFNPNIGGN